MSESLLFTLLPREESHHSKDYTPTFAICILFVVLFSLSTITHFTQAVAYKTWFMCFTAVLSGLIEILGWSARLWRSQDMENRTPNLIQITTIIIGPTPLLAACFVIMGQLIARLGSSYSRLSPKLYTIIFLSCDLISLSLQGLGGGKASSAASSDPPEDMSMGTNIMLAGIIFQVVAIVFFAMFSVEFLVRYLHQRPIRRATEDTSTTRGVLEPNLQKMFYAVAFTTSFLFIRGIYRITELSGGWNGPIMETQWLFNAFDGGMVTLAFYTFNIGHPGILLRQPYKLTLESESESYMMESS